MNTHVLNMNSCSYLALKQGLFNSTLNHWKHLKAVLLKLFWCQEIIYCRLCLWCLLAHSTARPLSSSFKALAGGACGLGRLGPVDSFAPKATPRDHLSEKWSVALARFSSKLFRCRLWHGWTCKSYVVTHWLILTQCNHEQTTLSNNLHLAESSCSTNL